MIRFAERGLGIAALLVSAVALTGVAGCGSAASPTAAAAVTSVSPTPSAIPDLCANLDPPMPSSTGSQTPAVPTQIPGISLAPASASPMLVSAYEQFNDMRCTRYQSTYREAWPSFFYYDCVGFTGYTLERAFPGAFSVVKEAVPFVPGQATGTPLEYLQFFQGLVAHPRAGWLPDATVQSIQPGDMIAWQPITASGAPTGVGHSVLPLTIPQAIAGSDGTRWMVVVEDSTQDPHGPDDTRRDPTLDQRNALAPDNLPGAEGTSVPSGLGIGTLAFDTNAQGVVTGVEWSVGSTPFAVTFGAARPVATPAS